MSSAVPTTSIAFQESRVSTALNSAMIFAFLMGAYTVVYLGTLYLYMTRRASQRQLIVATMSAMWVLAMLFFGSVWFGLDWCLVVNGDTREDISRCSSTRWASIVQLLSQAPLVIIADGLLVWRCFHVWDRSLRTIAFPLFLILMEIGTFVTSTIAVSIDKFRPSARERSIYNTITAATYTLSFLSTLTTTLLIEYRIWSVSDHHISSKGRFKHILEILVQSSAAHALAILVESIEGFLPQSLAIDFPARFWALQNYTDSLVFPIACIAPAVMVARVALLDSAEAHISTTRNLSDLRFQVRSTRPDETGTRLDASAAMDEVVDVEKNTP